MFPFFSSYVSIIQELVSTDQRMTLDCMDLTLHCMLSARMEFHPWTAKSSYYIQQRFSINCIEHLTMWKRFSELNQPSWVLVNRSGDHFKMRDIGRTGYVCKFDWHCWLWRGLSITNEWNGRDSLSGGNHAEPINGSWHIRLRMGSVQVGCRLNEYQWNQVNIYILRWATYIY